MSYSFMHCDHHCVPPYLQLPRSHELISRIELKKVHPVFSSWGLVQSDVSLHPQLLDMARPQLEEWIVSVSVCMSSIHVCDLVSATQAWH